jgi:hypothetical protein
VTEPWLPAAQPARNAVLALTEKIDPDFAVIAQLVYAVSGQRELSAVDAAPRTRRQ